MFALQLKFVLVVRRLLNMVMGTFRRKIISSNYMDMVLGTCRRKITSAKTPRNDVSSPWRETATGSQMYMELGTFLRKINSSNHGF
jgi:hypothetical protein